MLGLEKKNSENFKNLKENTTTQFKNQTAGYVCITRTTQNYSSIDDPDFTIFKNIYTPDSWIFMENFKGENNRNDFYMNNVVAHQFKATFEKKDCLMTLPKTITQSKIMNEKTEELLKKYEGNYDSKEFMKVFLEKTVNGKSTMRVANDYGLEIYKLTITTSKTGIFSATAHVRPNTLETKKTQ